jgi:hypothetical protein
VSPIFVIAITWDMGREKQETLYFSKFVDILKDLHGGKILSENTMMPGQNLYLYVFLHLFAKIYVC